MGSLAKLLFSSLERSIAKYLWEWFFFRDRLDENISRTVTLSVGKMGSCFGYRYPSFSLKTILRIESRGSSNNNGCQLEFLREMSSCSFAHSRCIQCNPLSSTNIYLT
ncbi:hypothetical protein BDV30DRAFT_122961 [Aspergillus minisclerotigenes]|uniref:Uncharacterized protein n=1 Tax=Aspergillus minisclerotigenes TaxID=656917 RepID=A0A5N6JID0_9EURO|nr:hypothetical protein BDV30DRAFT_122961 [Aspergillus minisclerotigenes]